MKNSHNQIDPASKPTTARRKIFGGLRRNEDGGALIEFALIIPFVLILTVGLVDIGRMMWYRSTIEQVAREGTRWAAVRGNESPTEVRVACGSLGPQVAAFVESRTVGIADSDMTITTTAPDCDSGEPVTVTVDMNFGFFISGFLPLATVPLRGQSTMSFS